MSLSFTKATKKAARGRIALIGPSGAGKTFTALSIGTHLGERVALIDTERGSASKYADRFSFDVLELDSFAPKTFVEAIHAAEAAGYDVIIIDSLSHAWMGKDGALEQVDRKASASQSGNSFAAWRSVTPQHNALVDAMIGARAHVIATMRTKTEWVIQENERGKKEPKKIGLAPVQRDGLDYEFDVTADLDRENNLIIDKTRCPALKDRIFPKAGADVAGILRAWLSDGVAATPSLRDEFLRRFSECQTTAEVEALGKEVAGARKRLTDSEVERIRDAARGAKERVMAVPATSAPPLTGSGDPERDAIASEPTGKASKKENAA